MIEIRPCRLVQEAERMLRSNGARRFSALVVRRESHALAFWDALADTGWRREPAATSKTPTSAQHYANNAE